jgi:DNA-binding transcriptional MerR regulator
MARPSGKSEHAFRTIGELATDLGIPQHILRYWETRFPQLRPLQRAGNRRYYRPADVALARRIHKLLNEDGYTIRGVQQLLTRGGSADDPAPGPPASPAPVPSAPAGVDPETRRPFPADELRALRRILADALAETAR